MIKDLCRMCQLFSEGGCQNGIGRGGRGGAAVHPSEGEGLSFAISGVAACAHAVKEGEREGEREGGTEEYE